MKIISPKYDYCMKELFRNEIVRRHFLSDVLDIPLDSIRSSRLLNTFLWKRYRNQKLGILDVLIELNDDTKINIEIQVKAAADWEKRQLFYISKLFTADIHVGEDYSGLKRCIGISILDFNLTERCEYHSTYRLKDNDGNLFSDMIELHILELRKNLIQKNPVNGWIRLFNAEREEDLDMIKTENAGILEAIREVKLMSLSKRLRAHYEAHMKDIRDRKAREKYVRQEGLEIGIEIFILYNLEEGKTNQQIIENLVNRFHLSEGEAIRFMEKYADRRQK